MTYHRTDLCPCCNQQLPEIERVYVDPIMAAVARRGVMVQLDPSSMLLFNALYEAAPLFVRRDELIAALFMIDADEDLPETDMVKQTIFKLRRELRSLNLGIENANKRANRRPASYRLVDLDGGEFAA